MGIPSGSVCGSLLSPGCYSVSDPTKTSINSLPDPSLNDNAVKITGLNMKIICNRLTGKLLAFPFADC